MRARRELGAAIAADRTLGQRLDPELPYVWAEVEFAARHDLARTVEDVLARRVPLLLVSRDQGLGVCDKVAGMLAQRARLGRRGDRAAGRGVSCGSRAEPALAAVSRSGV